jgi:hypothetical protein
MLQLPLSSLDRGHLCLCSFFGMKRFEFFFFIHFASVAFNPAVGAFSLHFPWQKVV